MATDVALNGSTTVATAKVDPATKRRELRLWPAVVLLALFWVFFVANRALELDMGTRFFSRLIAHGLLLLAFFGWWLSRGAVTWRDRLLALAVFIGGGVALLSVSDASISVFTILLTLLPWLFMAWIAALYLTRESSTSARRWAVVAAILLVLAPLPLMRWEGVDGTQRSDFRWRWSPTAEQLFLASHETQSREQGAPASEWQAGPEDVTGFRGKRRDGVVAGSHLKLDWTAAPKEIWRQRIGPAWSSLIVVNGHVVTQEQRDEAEVVACYDAATGKEAWVFEDAVRFHESLSGAGPRGTPTFADGKIFALGGKGNLHCVDAATGKPLWSHDLVAEAKATVPQWGFAVSPLVVDGKVIVFAPGKDADGLLAYDAVSGELKWKSAAGGDTYSSPQLVELGGVQQVLMQDNAALRSVSVDDGKLLWEYPSGGEMSVPMLQPRAVGSDRVLAAVDAGMALLKLQQVDGKWTVEEPWISNRIRPNFNDVVTHEGKVIGLDDGILCALDLETGERVWKKGRYGHGQVLLLADQDAVLVQGARGEVVLVGIGGDKPEELGRFEAIEGKSWNHPALVANRLYVRNGEEIACYELAVEN